jgi:hypothetical protein
MRNLNQRRCSLAACTLLAALVALTLPMAASAAADDAPKQIVVGPDKEIYGTQEAADLVAQARKLDPMYCQKDQVDRDKAALLYERAIAAQPGAKINAPLANRIAQLYAFYEDREKKVTPIRSKAVQWWNRCAESTSPKQLLWAEAQMGMASTAVIGKDLKSAQAFYDKILDMDASQIELPDWKAWPDGGTERGKAALEKEQTRLRDSTEGLQAHAAEKKFYVLSHIDKSAALAALGDIAARFKGAQAGKWASNTMTKFGGNGDPWALPDLTPQQTPTPQPAQPPKALAQDLARPARNQQLSAWHLDWPMTCLAAIGAASLVAGIVLTRRRKRLS